MQRERIESISSHNFLAPQTATQNRSCFLAYNRSTHPGVGAYCGCSTEALGSMSCDFNVDR